MKLKIRYKSSFVYTIIDDEDYEKVKQYKWYIKKVKYSSYVFARPKRKTIYLTHIILGKPSKGELIDHIDRDGLNNRKYNLRITNKSVNILNSCWYSKRYPQATLQNI